MAFRRQSRCYTSCRQFRLQQLALIAGEEHLLKRQLAIIRRDELGHSPLRIDDNSRLCINCNRLIVEDIALNEANPDILRLNIVTQTAARSCIICNAVENVHRLSEECRTKIFIDRNIYVPDGIRSCEDHLDEDGFLLNIHVMGLRFINRPINLRGPQLQSLLHHLRDACNKSRFLDSNNITENEFQCIAPISKEQFNELFIYCDPVRYNGRSRRVSKKDLLTFLCKLRQGLSDDFLKIIFGYSSRQMVSTVIAYVRESLVQRFVPANIGLGAITRHDYIERHVTEFSNILYNSEPENPKAIAIVDSTYVYINKNSNFQTLRQSYSLHKNRHLVKPTLIVAPNGYILSIIGPYFSDSRNNDAAILESEFEGDGDALREWFQGGDILLVNRGYRDAVQLLQRLGIDHKMPALLQRGQHQLTTEQANNSRIVTKNRWVVEARNGHIRSIFKFFAHTIQMHHAKHLNSFYNIAGAIINKYRPLIIMQDATAQLAKDILERSRTENVMQARVILDNLRGRNAQWRRINHQDVTDFPVLDLHYLKDLTVGIYQVSLAPSYIQDKLIRENDDEFQLDEHVNEPGLLRIRIYSRFRNASRHQLFISYMINLNEGDEDIDEANPISGYYCTYQSGARTLGTCAHVASILWFLGYGRHQAYVKYPDTSLLNTTFDAANRVPNVDLENQEEEEAIEVLHE